MPVWRHNVHNECQLQPLTYATIYKTIPFHAVGDLIHIQGLLGSTPPSWDNHFLKQTTTNTPTSHQCSCSETLCSPLSAQDSDDDESGSSKQVAAQDQRLRFSCLSLGVGPMVKGSWMILGIQVIFSFI